MYYDEHGSLAHTYGLRNAAINTTMLNFKAMVAVVQW
jgi:hypothetical protein